jgi:hypothetical protein
VTDRELGFHRVFTEYRSRAHRLQLEWTLTTEQTYDLLTSPCFYCGTGPGRVVTLKGRPWIDESDLFQCGGIDRIDNDKGYVPANSRPACTMCNLAKRHHPQDVFYAWIERVYQQKVKHETREDSGSSQWHRANPWSI